MLHTDQVYWSSFYQCRFYLVYSWFLSYDRLVMRVKEKKQHALGGKYSNFARCVRKFEVHQGKPIADCRFLRKIAHALEKWYGAKSVAKRLRDLAFKFECLSKRTGIKSVLSFRDGDSNDYRMICKLKTYLKRTGQWQDVVDYRLTMIGCKIREYDTKAKEDWNLKFGPKPSHRPLPPRVPTSLAESMGSVPIESRLDSDTRGAGVDFTPECEASKRIKIKEAENESDRSVEKII